MNKTEISLEFDKIKMQWAECALTEAARKEIQDTHLILSETELAVRLRETTESRQMLEKCGTPPLTSLDGIEELLSAAEKGQCLTPRELEKTASALAAVERLKSYLDRGKSCQIPLAYYEENLNPLEELREQLRYQIWNEQVSDNASKRLKSLRGDIQRAEDKMREKADAVMRANKDCMSDHFSTVRNGHVCIPVKKEYKFKISGILIDKSSTGSTLFIEPAASAKYYEELQELRIDEENEVRRILYGLTALVAENREIMTQNIRMMEKLDFIFSRGKLSEKYHGTEPKIIEERRIYLRNARHPLMDKDICVPLQFSLGEGVMKHSEINLQETAGKNVNGIVITGPNTGGKTVAIKTVALSCLMAQCGLHVACEEAEICMNRNILCDIGDGQNLSENLSTFSAHIVNVLDILKHVTAESLVVMDELGSGTDPAEGMGIAIAILEELKKSGALFLVTTHYPEVKVYAEQEETIVNARMTFDREKLKPLYQMVIGEAGESCAFYIAGRLGMPEYMLRRAVREAYGERGGQEYGFGGESGGRIECDVPVPGEETAGNDSSAPGGSAVMNGISSDNGQTAKRGGAKKEGTIVKGERFQPIGELPGGLLEETLKKETVPHIVKASGSRGKKHGTPFRRGDSVMIYPDKKIGIVCEPTNDKGVLRVQLPDRKIWINHKRVKLHVAAEELYPEDYDFSIIFDTVENRKLRHRMERKYVDGAEIVVDDCGGQ
ncbi:MAG TPA: DNA mismatch repair protein MutS [Lachnospiraceae bacterium]|nr:DNA mismatch repair protein MutS [Lachnospiraceae bacterium]